MNPLFSKKLVGSPLAGYEPGHTYDVDPALGAYLIARGLASGVSAGALSRADASRVENRHKSTPGLGLSALFHWFADVVRHAQRFRETSH